MAEDVSLIPYLKSNLEELLEQLEPNLEDSRARTDEQLTKLRIAYNLSILNEFTAIEEMCFEGSIGTSFNQIVLNPIILPKLMAFEITVVRESMRYNDAKDNDITVISLRKLASLFKAEEIHFEEEELQCVLLFNLKSGGIPQGSKGTD